MKILFRTICILALMGIFVPQGNGQGSKVTVDFANEIKPILESNCLRCHGEKDPEGGCRVDTAEEAMNYIEAGDSENSPFYEYLISEDEEEMMPPPDDGGPLDDSDIALIKTWIDEGANWPEGVVLTSSDQVAGDDSVDSNESKSDDSQPDIYKAIGSLHPAALHLPMGLLLAAGFFALLSLRGNFVMSDCAYYCLWLGTFGAIFASITGWWFVLDQRPSEYIEAQKLIEGLQDQGHKLFWHRTSALAVTIFSLILALFAANARNRDPDDGVGWKLGLIILAAGIGFVGHQGGKLTWKPSHYDELNKVIEHYIPGVFGENAEDPKLDDESIGDTSEESGPAGDVETTP